jgi:hypothetical protein
MRGSLSLLVALPLLITAATAASADEVATAPEPAPVVESAQDVAPTAEPTPAPTPTTDSTTTDAATTGPTTTDPATTGPTTTDPASTDPDVLRYRDWAALWWQWAAKAPAATNPMTDTTGAQCANDQTASVWFLAPVYGGGTANRSCTVPARTKLFFPIINSLSCAGPGETPTLKELRRIARPPIDNVTGVSVTVDGAPLPEWKIKYTKSVSFALTLGEGNVLQAPAGTYDPCGDVGYYAMVPSLSAGTHTVHFAASQGGTQTQDVTYTITVPKVKKTTA